MNPSEMPADAVPPALLSAHLDKLRRRDLNALVTLYAVLRTRSVSGAARLLGVTQPAVSRTLERLRSEFDDPLVLRQGNGVVPTQRARSIEAALVSMMDLTQQIFASGTFHPATAQRDVHLAMNEHLQQLLVPRLLDCTAHKAPGMRLFVRSILRSDMAVLKDGHLDMILGMLSPDEPLREMPLLRQRLLCVARPDVARNLVGDGALTLSAFGMHPQVDAQPAGIGQISAMLNELFKGTHTRRNIVCVVSSFEALMRTLETGPYLGVVPELALLPRWHETLAVVPLAFKLPTYAVSAWWHNVANHDPALQWLREQLRQICSELHCDVSERASGSS